ncbi:MAG: DUF4271 domain-containing protein [Chitinophagales bacterium]
MNDTSSVNPFYRDSILKNKMDSARWKMILSGQDIYRNPAKNLLIQHPKETAESTVFLYISLIIGLLILLLRLLFSDFMVSLFEGILSVKKFYIHIKSNKYDTILAVLWIYIVKLLLLSLILYIALAHSTGRRFHAFDTYFYIRILSSLSLFFVFKNMLEYIFNRVIQMQDSYKAFFLQNLFSELLIAAVLLLFLLIYIYNDFISLQALLGSIIFSAAVYVFFNTIRSYQLMGNVSIVHKLHFFLYICAFKILPVLVLVKYILNNVVA